MINYNYINIAAIEEVSGGIQDLTLDIISMFLKGAPELMSKIRESLDNKDHQEIARIAHKLKPMFAYVGAMGVKEELGEIEAQGKQEESFEILSLAIKEVEDKMDEIVRELNVLKSGLASDPGSG